MKKDVLAICLLAFGVVGVLGGIHYASGGLLVGWLGIAVGLALAGVSYSLTRGGTTTAAVVVAGAKAEPEPPM